MMRVRCMSWRARRRIASEAGFSVIEASIAVALTAALITALAAGLTGGLRAVQDARMYQQGTSIGEEAVESGRNLQFDSLAMQDSDLAGDPRIVAGPRFDPDGSAGSLASEPVVSASSGGSVFPHVTTRTVAGVVFTLSRYVTWVDDALQGGAGQSYKRLASIVEWRSGGRTNNYRTSSLVARARRGLPIPKFELAPLDQTLSVDAGNFVAFPHTLTNFGIVDTYDLEMEVPDGRNWVIQFYEDTNQNGLYDVAVDSVLQDTNSTGIPDTGSVGTNEKFYLLVVWLLVPTETGSETLTLTTTSGANDEVSKQATDRLNIGSPGITLYLHNNPTPPVGDTTAQKAMAMNADQPTAETLFKYSTNYYTLFSGRFIDKKNISAGETSAQYMANWVYQVPQTATFTGTATVKLWVAAKGFACDKLLHIRVHLSEKANGLTDTGTEFASADGLLSPSGLFGECPFQLITISPSVSRTIATNQWIELKVSVRNASQDAGLFAYDTLTYKATIKLPQVVT